MLKTSPLAPATFPEIGQVAGLGFTILRSGERYKGRDDVLLAVLTGGTTCAGVFTQSLTPGAPVIWSRQVHAGGKGRAVIVSAGNANVCTGKQGLANAQAMAKAVARFAGLQAEHVYVCSTGVIGEQIKIERILAAIPTNMDFSKSQDWHGAASAILTTDTYPKAASTHIKLGKKQVTVSGIAKGSGMIEPNMATMLSYVFTDAAIESDVLQTMLNEVVDKTFNCITVDSDTSTSDTCLIFASGQAGNACIEHIDSPDAKQLKRALERVMLDLAQQIIKDGEGASKFITVSVTGAASDQSARKMAKSIANSPLVKTAIAGEDANWGRIVMAVGKADEPIDFDKLSISVGGVVIAEGDGPLAEYDERLVQAHIEGQEVSIDVDVGLGEPGSAVVWTCDLTHGYIDINADYRS